MIKYKHLPKHKKYLLERHGTKNRYCYEIRYEIEVDYGEIIVEGVNILKEEKMSSKELTDEAMTIFYSMDKRNHYRKFRLLSTDLVNAYYIKPGIMKEFAK